MGLFLTLPQSSRSFLSASDLFHFMRVGVDATPLLFGGGGIARYAQGLLEGLCQVAEDVELSLFFSAWGRERKKIQTWQSVFPRASLVATSFPRKVLQYFWLRRLFPIERFLGKLDIFHSFHIHLPAVKRARRVLTVHDCIYLSHPELYTDSSIYQYEFDYLLPLTLAQADAVIAISSATKHALLNHFNISENKITVIPYGVKRPPKETSLKEGPAAERKEHSLCSPFALYVAGTLEPRKNISRTLLAFQKVVHQLGEVHLLIALFAPSAEAQKKLVEERNALGLEEHVTFFFNLSEKELELLYQRALFFIYPSLYEGFGLPILEAMVRGLPVITSNTSSMPEVAGDAALLVSPRDEESLASAMLTLFGNAELRKELSQKSVKRAAVFSWEKTAEQTLSLYRSLL